MAGKKLAANVYVDGTMYEAGSVPPADVAKLITNPKAWGDDPEPDEAKPARKPAGR